MLGLVNIVVNGAREAARPRGGFWAWLVGLAALVVGLIWAYRAADAALVGIAASTAEVNRVLGWAFAIVLVLAAVVAGVWILLGRRRAIAEAPKVERLRAEIDAARAAQARAQVAGRRPGGRAVGPTTSGHQRERITAERLDRLPSGEARR